MDTCPQSVLIVLPYALQFHRSTIPNSFIPDFTRWSRGWYFWENYSARIFFYNNDGYWEKCTSVQTHWADFIIFALGRKSAKIRQKCFRGGMLGLKGRFVFHFWRFLFHCRNIKKVLNFGGLRIAWELGNVVLVMILRVLRRFLQLIDNENLRKRKRRFGFLFKSSEL